MHQGASFLKSSVLSGFWAFGLQGRWGLKCLSCFKVGVKGRAFQVFGCRNFGPGSEAVEIIKVTPVVCRTFLGNAA